MEAKISKLEKRSIGIIPSEGYREKDFTRTDRDLVIYWTKLCGITYM